MDELRVEKLVEFAVKETFSLVSWREVGSDELVHTASHLISERWGLKMGDAAKIYRPIYWGLVSTAPNLDGIHPLVSLSDRKKIGRGIASDYIVAREGMKLDCPALLADWCERIRDKYGVTLDSRLKRASNPSRQD